MVAGVPIVVEGLTEMKAALRATEGASTKEITAGLKTGADAITTRTKSYIHSRSGRLAGDAKAYATLRSAGVRFTLVYAPVQEFATTWTRRPRGQGTARGGPVLSKRVTGGDTVHYTGATPRFAYRAVNELGPALVENTFVALVDVLKAHGWFA